MAEWWLLNTGTQEKIAEFIDEASDRVIDNFDVHGNENSLTAALGQELSAKTLFLGDTTVTFNYRNFLEQQEEPVTGADGGFFVTIANGNEVVEKGVFYQAKRFSKDLPTRSLNMTRKDASRLKKQVLAMLRHTDYSILLGQTRNNFYAVDAQSLASETVENLRFPFFDARLLTLGTYLGSWVARCTKGDMRKSFIEVSTASSQNRELIKVFMESGFVISGRQANRYGVKGEIIFLTLEVEQIYGYDPYDNLSASEWIVKKFLKADRLTPLDQKIRLKTSDNLSIWQEAYGFYSGAKFEASPEDMFNTRNCLVVLPEYFPQLRSVEKVKELDPPPNEFSRAFIFDYSKPQVVDREMPYATVFGRDALFELMYGQRRNRLRRFDFADIGGLLLISNPTRYPFKKQESSELNGEAPYYIKLGAVGRYLAEDMPIVFAYYPEKGQRSSLQIWGIGEILGDPIPINLADLRQDHEAGDKSSGTLLFKRLADFEGRLLRPLSEASNENVDFILWKKSEFNHHNAYNATDRIVAFRISRLKCLKTRVDIDEVLDDRSYTEDIENVLDTYLNKQEVAKLYSIANLTERESPSIASDGIEGVVNILFLSANPMETARIQCEREHQIVTEEIRKANHRELLKLIAPPLLHVNLDEFLRSLNESEPNIIHFSGHGNRSGVEFTHRSKSKSVDTVTVKTLKSALTPHSIKCVILNSCYSAPIAREISSLGLIVIGIRRKIGDDAALTFARGFYQGLGSTLNFLSAAQVGRTLLGHEHGKYQNVIQVWQDGKRIGLRTN